MSSSTKRSRRLSGIPLGAYLLLSRGQNMFEHSSEPLLPWPRFLMRLAQSGGIALTLVSTSLLVGMLGYHGFEHLSWIDAFLNASMLLGGMGPVNAPTTFSGKIFAGLYSLYCGLVVIFVAGVLLAPLLHRLLHKFHLQQESD